ncbi:MAG: Slp family lipoprotein [Proteobacteria bacterium]|nr:Slp family lipoprotein [Pseudomonadota bacterium]
MIFIVISFSSCAHVISGELLERTDRTISTRSLFEDPNLWKGKIVILGGNIVGSLNRSEGTYIEVVQKELSGTGKPKFTDISDGRFLILYDGYLDTAIYSKGRLVTVAGEVMGSKVRSLGEIDYSYLLLKSLELHLLQPGSRPTVSFGIGISERF